MPATGRRDGGPPARRRRTRRRAAAALPCPSRRTASCRRGGRRSAAGARSPRRAAGRRTDARAHTMSVGAAGGRPRVGPMLRPTALAAVTGLLLAAAGPAAAGTGSRPPTATATRPAVASPASHTAAGTRTPGARVTRKTIRGAHDAGQVITVTAPRRGTQHAEVQAFTKTAHGWHRVRGPWRAWVGRDGLAAPGRKREGDGRTPSGTFTFSFFFGAAAKPAGIHYSWRHAGPSDYWDDDSSSARYNEWVDTRHHSAGRDPEPLDVRPSYDDVAVIHYNPQRVPHRGSAIFLHVTHDSATSGCVALPRSELMTLLRWLRPRDHA